MGKYQPSEGYRDLCLRAHAIFRERPIDLEESALLLAQVFYRKDGLTAVTRAHPGFYCAMHAISTWERVVVNQLKPAVARRVRDLHLGYVPTEPPPLFDRPWFIEVKRGGDDRERLFGNTIALCGFRLLPIDMWILIGWRLNGNYNFYTIEKWPTTWGADDLGISEVEEGVSSTLKDGRWVLSRDVNRFVFGDSDWLSQAVKYAVSLGELLAAEQAPIRIEEERRPNRSQERSGGRKSGSPRDLRWVVRHLYLDEPPRIKHDGDIRSSDTNAPAAGVATDVSVRAHVRRQRFGTGRTQVKRIYIDPYTAQRWKTADRPLKVVVDTKRSKK